MRVLPLLIALTALAASIAAGFWQLDRERQKRELGQTVEAAANAPAHDLGDARAHLPSALWHRVTLRGRYLAADTVLLDNRVHQGKVGYQVITPFELVDRRHVLLVDRGWIPVGTTRADLPRIDTPPGIVTIGGRLVPLPGKTLELASVDPAQPVWLNLDLERYRRGRNLDPAPYLVRQSAPEEPGLVREWPAPNLGTDKHRAYAMQWFAMAIVALVFLVMFVVRGRRPPSTTTTGPGASAVDPKHVAQKHDPH